MNYREALKTLSECGIGAVIIQDEKMTIHTINEDILVIISINYITTNKSKIIHIITNISILLKRSNILSI